MSYSKRFEGDPKVYIDEDGSFLKWVNGQPVMDQGFENFEIISLLTEGEYWGDFLETDPDEKFKNCRFIDSQNTSINISSLNSYRTNAEFALEWLVKNKIAKELIVNVTNPNGNRLNFEIVTKSPTNQDVINLSNVNNKWYYQANNPAYLKE
jgi:phage gp46-like protein